MAKKLDWEKQNKLRQSKGAREDLIKIAGALESHTFQGNEKPDTDYGLDSPLAKTASKQCPYCGTYVRAARYTRHFNKFHESNLDKEKK